MVDRASLCSPRTGISLKFSTDQPSVQVYTGNSLNGTDPNLRLVRKASQIVGNAPQYYQWRGAITFEAQQFPDAVNHKNFPDVFLAPGKSFSSRSSYCFSLDADCRSDGDS